MKKKAKAKAVPKIAMNEIKPAVDKTAIPLRAAPLAQPLPNEAPIPTITPPRPATISHFLDVILGECSTFSFNLPDNAPEIKPPKTTPIISKTSHEFSGL